MNSSTAIVTSINNIRNLVNNSILMLRDLDAALSKKGFEPIYGNALGTETSKSINQSISQYSNFFPQFMARQYALKSENDAEKVNKIIFTNIQFYHGKYEETTPTLTNSVMIFPKTVKNIKVFVQNWWLKWTVFENQTWDESHNNGELNEHIDGDGIRTIYWSKDLLSFGGQKDLLVEAEQLLKVFNNHS